MTTPEMLNVIDEALEQYRHDTLLAALHTDLRNHEPWCEASPTCYGNPLATDRHHERPARSAA